MAKKQREGRFGVEILEFDINGLVHTVHTDRHTKSILCSFAWILEEDKAIRPSDEAIKALEKFVKIHYENRDKLLMECASISNPINPG